MVIKSGSPKSGYYLAAALGALAGGITVALATRAIPTILGRLMADMMEKMMAGMAGEGCDPAER